jgi:hypothetical protein
MHNFLDLLKKRGFRVLAYNTSIWCYAYDDITLYAFLCDKDCNLNIVFYKKHIKSGIGKGEFNTLIDTIDIGSLTTVNIKNISSILKQQASSYVDRGFKKTWTTIDGNDCKLSEVLAKYKKIAIWNKI